MEMMVLLLLRLLFPTSKLNLLKLEHINGYVLLTSQVFVLFVLVVEVLLVVIMVLAQAAVDCAIKIIFQ